MEDSSLEGINELVWADRKGRLQSVIAPAQPGMAEPAISPDGQRVAVTAIVEQSRDIWVYDLERGTRSRLSFEDSTESGPSWYPSSKRIAYTEIRGILDADIVARNADGSGRRQVLVEGTGIGLWGGTIEISPDGKSILYAVDNRGRKMFRVAPVSSDGTVGEGVPLLDSGPSLEGSILDAHISPDGKLLAYMSTQSGQPEVFLTRYPSAEGRWQISTDGGRMPRWARDTGELFYISGSGPSVRALSAVTVQSTPEVVIGSPQQLFRSSLGIANSVGALSFDVSPDGDRFALLRPAVGSDLPPRRMILVQNWYEEFRERR
jgi:Tol biopolymer transport system component